jgi:hypothetical protein
VLAAVVLAAGLAFISRGLGAQLKALRAVEDSQTLMSLARGKLAELESALLAGRPLPEERSGTFEPPHEGYRWALEAVLREDLLHGDTPWASDVTLTVERAEGPAASLRLGAIWLSAWVSP